MKRLGNHLIGIDQGDVVLFADFEHGGEMWTGTGPRERVHPVLFADRFQNVPTVHVSVSLWDMDTTAAIRAELVTQNVTTEGFDIVFRTWLDSRVARIRAAWMAIGELRHADDWEIG